MGAVKGFAMTALSVVAVLVVLHYVAPAAIKQHTGTT
jgi:hypothetical protein